MSRDADALPRGRRQGGAAAGARNVVVRIVRAWNMLEPEQRLAAVAALALWVTMLLPWYVDTISIVPAKGSAQVTRETLTAFGSFSFVEAAVLLVSAGVLALLFARAERRAFHLPGGDGFIITAGGVWTAILIFYRMLDTPHASVSASRVVTDVGLKWGIFLALIAAIGLGWAGVRVKAAHKPEPDLASDPTVSAAVRPATARPPGDNAPHPPRYPPPPGSSPRSGGPPRPSGRPRSGGAERTERTTRAVTREDAEQLSFDVPEPPPSEPDPFGERRR
jgi:hypothetical protein